MDTTTNLEIPLILPSQAQKHVTHNEALRVLDALVQLSVLDRDHAEPPGPASEGERYIVAAGGSGPWSGHDGAVAAFQDGGWVFHEPRPGWIAWVEDEQTLLIWSGAAWTDLADAVHELHDIHRLGIGTGADDTNRFAAKLNNALWTARETGEGGDGDLRYVMNKEDGAKVLSLLMQSGWSGRAEIGLIGEDDLSLKVSADGAAWTTALSVDRATGRAILAADPVAAMGAATKQYADTRVAKTGDTMTGGLSLVGSFANGVRYQRSSDIFNGHAALLLQRSRTGGGAVQSGDWICGVIGGAWDGAQYQNNANFSFRAAEDATPSAAGADFVVRLANIGGLSVFDRLFVTAEGHIALGARTNVVVDANRHHRLRSYTVAGLPAAGAAGGLIYVSDESGGPVPAFSDGTNWRRATDRAIVS